MKTIFTLSFTLILAQSFISQVSHTINAGNFYYAPTTLTIDAGDTVNWVNDGGFHNVNFSTNTITGSSFNNPESFISSPTNNNDIYTYVFNVPGTYDYDCSVGSHAANGMVGTIIVNQSSASIDEALTSLDESIKIVLSEKLNVQFESSKSFTNGSIDVFGLDGRKVLTQDISVKAGLNNYSFSLKNTVNNTILVLTINLDGNQITKKIGTIK